MHVKNTMSASSNFILLYLGSLYPEVRLTECEVMALKPFHQFIE